MFPEQSRRMIPKPRVQQIDRTSFPHCVRSQLEASGFLCDVLDAGRQIRTAWRRRCRCCRRSAWCSGLSARTLKAANSKSQLRRSQRVRRRRAKRIVFPCCVLLLTLPCYTKPRCASITLVGSNAAVPSVAIIIQIAMGGLPEFGFHACFVTGSRSNAAAISRAALAHIYNTRAL